MFGAVSISSSPVMLLLLRPPGLPATALSVIFLSPPPVAFFVGCGSWCIDPDSICRKFTSSSPFVDAGTICKNSPKIGCQDPPGGRQRARALVSKREYQIIPSPHHSGPLCGERNTNVENHMPDGNWLVTRLAIRAEGEGHAPTQRLSGSNLRGAGRMLGENVPRNENSPVAECF